MIKLSRVETKVNSVAKSVPQEVSYSVISCRDKLNFTLVCMYILYI